MATKKKSSKKKLSLKERMQKRKQELASRGGAGNVEYLKDEGTYRIRVLPTIDPEAEFVIDVTSFYLGKDMGSVYSPSTFGQPCALMEAYKELKESDDEDDKDILERLQPRTSYLTPVIFYKDEKGKKVDEERSGKLLKISKGIYQQFIDLYLDEDEWGDMNDPKEGYDIKITRTGKGRYDTEYDAKPCKNTPIDKKWRKPVDPEEMVKAIIPTYEETVEKRDEFLNLGPDDDDDSGKKKGKKSKGKKSKDKKSKSSNKKSKSKKSKGKKKKSDI